MIILSVMLQVMFIFFSHLNGARLLGNCVSKQPQLHFSILNQQIEMLQEGMQSPSKN